MHKTKEPIIFNTANGKTACGDAVHMVVKELGEDIEKGTMFTDMMSICKEAAIVLITSEF